MKLLFITFNYWSAVDFEVYFNMSIYLYLYYNVIVVRKLLLPWCLFDLPCDDAQPVIFSFENSWAFTTRFCVLLVIMDSKSVAYNPFFITG